MAKAGEEQQAPSDMCYKSRGTGRVDSRGLSSPQQEQIPSWEDAQCALGHSVKLIWAGCNESAAGDSDGANKNLLLLWRKLVPP